MSASCPRQRVSILKCVLQSPLRNDSRFSPRIEACNCDLWAQIPGDRCERLKRRFAAAKGKAELIDDAVRQLAAEIERELSRVIGVGRSIVGKVSSDERQ